MGRYQDRRRPGRIRQDRSAAENVTRTGKLFPRGMARHGHVVGQGNFPGSGRIAARARSTLLRPAGPSLPLSKRDQIEPAKPLPGQASPGRLAVTRPRSPDLVLSWPLAENGAAHLCQMPADRR